MLECEPLCIEKNKEYVKTHLCGNCKIKCGYTIILFDGKCFCDSFGTIEFKNEGDCEIQIYVNQLPDPVSIIPPDGCFYLASTPLNKIIIKCKKICECTNCQETSTCTLSKGWPNCNCDKCSHDKCILYYKGWIYSKITDIDCPEICCNK
ncbi:MAG: hypothetical protein Q7K36_02775 [Fusobacterium sp. JB020]|nr:hypothetical protein [Fusobacterium sp. JB020]